MRGFYRCRKRACKMSVLADACFVRGGGYHIYRYICICTYVYIYIYLPICIFCMYTHIYIYIHTYLCMQMYVYIKNMYTRRIFLFVYESWEQASKRLGSKWRFAQAWLFWARMRRTANSERVGSGVSVWSTELSCGEPEKVGSHVFPSYEGKQ